MLTQQIEKGDEILQTVHQFKEDELQLRREEKNLLIRGYSLPGFHQWQQAKENFHQTFGQLIGLNALSNEEIDELKNINSEMSDAYKDFFDRIQSSTIGDNKVSQYDAQFKKIGERSLEIIDNILEREQAASESMNSRAHVLIIIFSIVFVGTTSFLVVNVMKNL